MTVLLLMTFGALFQVLTLDAVVQRLESKESVRELNHTFIIHSQVRFFFFWKLQWARHWGFLEENALLVFEDLTVELGR